MPDITPEAPAPPPSPRDSHWLKNECMFCYAQPGEPCTWVHEPTEKYPDPVGSPYPGIHAGRKYYIDSISGLQHDMVEQIVVEADMPQRLAD